MLLSFGEWLWLLPLALFALVYAAGRIGGQDAGLGLIATCVLVQCAFSIVAFFRLVALIFGVKLHVACRWTELFGTSVCAFVGPAILYFIFVALSQL